MFGLNNPVHILFLLVLLLLVFGAKRLPEMGRSLGSGMRGFKESLSGEANHTSEIGQPVQDVASEEHAQPVSIVGEHRP
jgi:sec-independent protein translocase protein TatA